MNNTVKCVKSGRLPISPHCHFTCSHFVYRIPIAPTLDYVFIPTSFSSENLICKMQRFQLLASNIHLRFQCLKGVLWNDFFTIGKMVIGPRVMSRQMRNGWNGNSLSGNCTSVDTYSCFRLYKMIWENLILYGPRHEKICLCHMWTTKM